MAGRSGRAIAIAVLVIGFGAGALASWFMIGARPRVGAFVDAVAVDGGALAIRKEKTSDRAFAELWRVDGDRVVSGWSGLVPRYAGRPGVITAAATRAVATVRVIRGGRPQLFAFDLVHGAKIASFELDRTLPASPAAWTLPSVGTIGADEHAIEALADGQGGGVLIAVDLGKRALVWRKTVPWTPARVWIAGDTVGAADASGAQQAGFALATGDALAAPPAPPAGLGEGLTYDAATRTLRAAGGATYVLPPDALTPEPYHVGHGLIWIVTPAGLTALSTTDLAVRAR